MGQKVSCLRWCRILSSTREGAGESDAAEPNDGPFWSLPQELLDIIFEYAYSRQDPLRLKSRSEWDVREARAYGNDPVRYRIRPFEHAVNRFLISKAYYLHAIGAWIGSSEWDAVCDQVLFRQELLGQFAQSIGPMRYPIFSIWRKDIIKMERLDTLILDIDTFVRSLFDNAKCPLTETFLREDILILPIVGDVVSLQSLRSVRLIPNDMIWRLKHAAEKAQWAANVKHMETVIQSLLDERLRQSQDRFLRPADTGNHPGARKKWRESRKKGDRKHKCTSLYNRSAVCACCPDGRKSLPSWTPSRARWTIPHRFEDLPNSLEGMRELISDQRESAAEWLWRLKQEKSFHEHPSGQ